MAKKRKLPKQPKKPKGTPTPAQVKAYETRVKKHLEKLAEIKAFNAALARTKDQVAKLAEKVTKAREAARAV